MDAMWTPMGQSFTIEYLDNTALFCLLQAPPLSCLMLEDVMSCCCVYRCNFRLKGILQICTSEREIMIVERERERKLSKEGESEFPLGVSCSTLQYWITCVNFSSFYHQLLNSFLLQLDIYSLEQGLYQETMYRKKYKMDKFQVRCSSFSVIIYIIIIREIHDCAHCYHISIKYVVQT